MLHTHTIGCEKCKAEIRSFSDDCGWGSGWPIYALCKSCQAKNEGVKTMEKFGPYLVSGQGVSMICTDRTSVLEWCDYILLRGGFPTVKPYIADAKVA